VGREAIKVTRRRNKKQNYCCSSKRDKARARWLPASESAQSFSSAQIAPKIPALFGGIKINHRWVVFIFKSEHQPASQRKRERARQTFVGG
jgi:hypothetical protein